MTDYSTLLNALPEKYALCVSAFIILCKLVTVFVKPPAATSKLAWLYQIVSLIGLNVGWAANRLQVDKTGVMVKRSDADQAKRVLGYANIPLASPKPTDRPS
ncbi:MAG: hypothetical protein ABF689_06930 [Gluconobacter cerinus]|uniref:hypothetical protein n=1 Tax=Gluconobacter cerinus TaxID=38307 RepID=UPI0039EB5C6E